MAKGLRKRFIFCAPHNSQYEIMSDPLYQGTLLEHYHAPRNYGLQDDFDAEARVDNLLCGDSITMRIAFDQARVRAVSFAHAGCVISRASASLLTEYIKGRARGEVRGLSPGVAVALLQAPLTPARIRCALLPLEAILKMV